MAPLHSFLVSLMINTWTLLTLASANTADLETRDIQQFLGRTCRNLIEPNGIIKAENSWNCGSCYADVIHEIHLPVAEPSPTIKSTTTVTNYANGPITAPPILQVRNAEPDAQGGVVAGLLGVGGSTTDMNDQINAAKSQASVIFAASMSQLSDRFQASIQNLQSSASSVISLANVTMQMALQASSSAKEAASTAESSLMSLQASASSAMAVASSQVQSAAQAVASANSAMGVATGAAAAASLQAQAADVRAQQQVAMSQAQAQATAKIAIAVVASVVGSSVISILGFCLISRYRSRRQRGRKESVSGDRRGEKQQPYSSNNSHHDSRNLRTSHDERRSRSPLSPQPRREYLPPRLIEDTMLEKKTLNPTVREVVDDERRSRSRVSPQPREYLPPRLIDDTMPEKKTPNPTVREVVDDFEFSENGSSVFNSTEVPPIVQNQEPVQGNRNQPIGQTKKPFNVERKHITPTFVSRWAKERAPFPPPRGP